LLAQLIARVNVEQLKSGELKKLEDREYKGQKYFCRVEDKNTGFYCLRGPVLIVGFQEKILHEMLDLDATASRTKEPPVAREFRLLGMERPLAALWINPRTFEPALQRKADQAKGAEAVTLKALLSYWKALEGLGFAIHLQKDFELSLAVRARVEQLPAVARRFFGMAGQKSDLWERFPETAILIVASRVDPSAFLDVLSEFATEDARKALHDVVDHTLGAIVGKGVLKDLLSAVGPDYGLCVVAPSAKDSGWFPQVIAALRVRQAETGTSTELALMNSLTSLVSLAVFYGNQGHPGALALKSRAQDKGEVKYVVNDEQFPPGFQPAFAIKGTFLLLASSPDAIQRFQSGSATPPSRNTENMVLRLSLRELGQYLTAQRDSLAAYVAEKNQIPRADAGERLDKLIAVLQFFDRIELSHRSDPGRIVITLRIRMDKPLR
jgi:hypothetical protein